MSATRRARRDPQCECSACGRCSGLAAGPLSQPAERSSANSAMPSRSQREQQHQQSSDSTNQLSARQLKMRQATAAASGGATLQDHGRAGPATQAMAPCRLPVSKLSRREPPSWVRPLCLVPQPCSPAALLRHAHDTPLQQFVSVAHERRRHDVPVFLFANHWP